MYIRSIIFVFPVNILCLLFTIMDKFVTVIKPSARTLASDSTGGKQTKQKQRVPYRYNPYSDAKSNERKPGDLKEKRRVEKYALPTKDFTHRGSLRIFWLAVCLHPL
jgi:hypothetical protein